MKGYKGFSKGLVCRGKQYAENTVFEEENAEICRSGMHFCDLPHAVFEYYAPGENNEFAKVEALGEAKTDDGRKYCAKILKIGAKVSVFDMVKVSVSAFFEQNNFNDRIAEVKVVDGAANAGNKGAANAGYRGAANAGYCGAANAGDYGAANAGDYGAANAGDYGAANAGNKGAANAGDYGAANAGNKGAANAGYCGAANAGDYGAANAGDYGAANAGNKGAANAGNCGAAIVRADGTASVGKNGAAVALGLGGKVKGKLGAILVLTETDGEGNIIDFAVERVDGERIKEDTFYELRDGEFCEVK